MEMEETKIGRLPHKIEKLKTLGERTPGVEFLRSEVFSGDHGLAVIEYAPFGVIGAITPVTHSLPTITGNAVNMIAARQHAGRQSASQRQAGGGRGRAALQPGDLSRPGHRQPDLRDRRADDRIGRRDFQAPRREADLRHRRPGRRPGRACNSSKRAIVAGPGNPPVVVDETADLDRAARCIIQGGAYDNNLLCIAEKEVFVVAEVFDAMMAAMDRAGAVRLNAKEVDALTRVAIATVGEGEDKHDVPAKEFHRPGCGRAGPRHRQANLAADRIAVRRDRRAQSVRPGRADDAVHAVRPLPRRGRGDRKRRNTTSTASATRPSSTRTTCAT